MSDQFLRQALGISGGEKRIYHVDESKVTAEEYEVARMFVNVLFGPGGLAENLGGSWKMVHDPRFMDIEECFIFDRDSVFGGDASLGKFHVTAAGAMSSTNASLEEYATILGEGRHFLRAFETRGYAPTEVKSLDAAILWEVIKQECPNYFHRNGDQNKEGEKLFRLLRADVVGLVHDYSQISLSADWIDAETLEVVHEDETHDADGNERMIVHVEVDTLDKALHLRAQARVTAYRLMKDMPGVAKLFDGVELTDHERDLLLQKLFRTEFNQLYTVYPTLVAMVTTFTSRPLAVREDEQRTKALLEAAELHMDLKTGKLEQVRTPIEEMKDDAEDFRKDLVYADNQEFEAALVARAEQVGREADELEKNKSTTSNT